MILPAVFGTKSSGPRSPTKENLPTGGEPPSAKVPPNIFMTPLIRLPKSNPPPPPEPPDPVVGVPVCNAFAIEFESGTVIV